MHTRNWKWGVFKALDLIVVMVMILSSPLTVLAAGGSYSLNWTAADPAVNNAPYLPTYSKVPPTSLACPTPSGSGGRASDPLANAVFGNPKDSVESLAPPSMALGQIVPFEVKITVSGSTAPENGVIQFTPYWLTKVTSGGNFGYDPAYKVYCAFVDTADAASVDPGANAKVDSWTDTVVNTGTSNEQIQGTIQVSGLDNGDSVIVEIWVVLKNTIPPGISGNVQTGLVSARTITGETINTGNQTVPLLRVGEFFSSNADVSVTKSDSPDPVTAGQQLTYSLVVTNNSTTTVANGVVVTDTLDPNTTYVSASGATCSTASGVVTCNVGALVPLQTATITLTVNVSASAPTAITAGTNPATGTCTAGSADLCNRVSVSAITSDPNTGNNSDSEPTNVVPAPKPSLTLLKQIGTSATGPWSSSINVTAGDSVYYQFVITNTGDVPLSPISVSDPNVSTSGCAFTNPLPAGASTTCVVGPVTALEGTHPNTATASGGYGGQTYTSGPSSATYIAVPKPAPALTLGKTATPATYDAVGDVINYNYKLTNSGNVTLSSPYTVNDDKATVTCPSTPVSLAIGEFITCTASYTITQADIEAGSVTNTATAHAFYNATTIDSNQDSETVTAEKLPALSLIKTATPADYDAVGDVISYSYKLSNSGNVTLSGPFTVTDNKVTASCPVEPSTLTPGAFTTCTASHTVTQEDLEAGSVTNTAKGHAFFGDTPIDSNEDSETVTAKAMPELTLVKTANPVTYDSVGDVISYSYMLTNSGNITLSGPFAVNDDKAVVTCPATASLAPLESITCTASYTVKQEDLEAGFVTNTAMGHGFFGENPIDSNEDSETVTADQMPALSLIKTATPATYSAISEVISYSYLVKNTGNVTLAGPVTVTDDKATVTCPPGGLAPQAEITCTASYTITQSDLDAGNVKNTAQAHANGTDSNLDDETVTAVAAPALTIVKTATPATYDKVGDVISYSYDVTNSGNVTLSGISVVDDKATVTCPDTTAGLAPGAKITCTASYTITQADVDSGSVTNNAYATDGTTQSQPDSETVTADKQPALTIDKTATPSSYTAAGDVISYSYLVTNSGNVTLYGITVTDDKATVTCPDTSAGLAPTGTITCAAAYTVTQADLDAGSVTNSAYATDGTTQSPPDTVTVPGTQAPALALDKRADPLTYDAVGDVISYSYLLTNSGNVTLTSPFTVTDTKISVTCPSTPAALAPLASITCTASYTITQADLDYGSVMNSAVGHAFFGAAPVDSNPDTQTVYAVPIPALAIAKTATPTTYNAVGDVINYSYLVTNTGNVTLYQVTVEDDRATVLCPDTQTEPLGPQSSMTCTASYTITQADLDAGSVTNTAFAKDGETKSEPDSETVNAIPMPALSIVKTATPGTYDAVGDVIDYSYLVTNTGNVTLYNIIVVDNKVEVTCPAGAASLAPLATVTCTASHTITQADLDGGSITNTAYATDGTTQSQPDSETVTADKKPALTIVRRQPPPRTTR